MPKNIVVCCDGTANEFAQDNTNVVKLYATLVQNSPGQVTFYHPGIGTMEPAGALTNFSRKVTKLLGMALGYGLSNDIRDAYVFLMNNYQEGDRVFLFGFSRGAYTVRVVAAMLYNYGLIRVGNEPLVPYAIRLLTGMERGNQSNSPAGKEAANRYFDLARKFKATLSRTDCKPHFVGIWDTVSSVGWIGSPLAVPNEANNPDIQFGRHAISIDEHRAFFRNHLWRHSDTAGNPFGPKDEKQVWFAGVHCDVGGGYPEAESGLSKVALEWMLEEAKPAGLLVDAAKEADVLGANGSRNYIAPNAKAEFHESLKGWWRIAEFVPKKHFDAKTAKSGKRMNLFRRRTMPPKSLVHESVLERGDEYRKRLPADVEFVKTVRYRPSQAADAS